MKKTIINDKSITGQKNKRQPNKKAIKPKSQRVESERNQTHTLEGRAIRYRYLFEHLLNGVAYCKMIFENGQPQDFIYLEVNSAFESLTGLKDVVGKKVTEVVPGIREANPELFEVYGRVAMTGKPERVETHVEALKMRFSISVYSYEKKYFLAVFDLITETQHAAEYFRKLVDASPDAIVVTNSTGKIILVNLQTEELFGYSRYEILGKNVDSLLPERYRSRHGINRLTYFHKPLVRQMGVGLALFALTKDGAEFPVDISLSPLQTEEGILVMAAIRNVTERKRSEAELHQSEEFTRLLVRGVRDYAIFMLDPTGRVVSWNAGAERIKGFRADEIIGEHFSRFYKDVDVKSGKPEKELEIARQTGHFREVGMRVRKDGSEFLADVTISPLYDEDGKLRGFARLTRDITERRQAEDALSRSEQDYRMLFENLPIALYRSAADGRILDANPAMVKMFGYKDRESILPVNISDLHVDPDSNKKFTSEIEKTDFIFNFEAELKRLDGTTFWSEDRSQIIRDEDGKLMFYEGSLIDITERKRSEEKIRRQLGQLAALREIDRVIASSFDLRYNLGWILDNLTKELGVDAADILILNPVSSRLEYGGGTGFRTKSTEKEIMQSGLRYAMRAVLDRQLVYFPNLKDEPNDLLATNVLADEDFACYYGVPLMAKGSVKGVLEIFQRTSREPDQEWLDFTNSMASQAALAIDNASLFENLQRSNIDLTLAYDATIEGWSRAMDLRDKETEGHTQRVTVIALELAGRFGIKDEELVGVRRGALLHDIGKMGVPDGILLKPGPLTEEEWIIMKKHPALAFEMLSPIHYLQSAMDIPYCHHEKWDGTGYPRGLKGDQIPLTARIFSVVDVWDALTSDRPYRGAWSNEKVLEYLKSESGKHFDPQVLKTCLESGVFDRKDFK